MPLGVILLQIVLPLALLAWLGLAPLPSALGYVVQLAATALVLLALGLVALWAGPPWYLPWAYALLLALIAAARLARSGLSFPTLLPGRWDGWALALLLCAVGAFAAYASAQALLGRRLPDRPVADIASPLPTGTYLVAHGGSRMIVNAHLKTLEAETPRMRAYRGQSYAVDLLQIDSLGRRKTDGSPTDPASYRIFGTPVLAPCGGRVVSARADRDDMPVPEMDKEVLEGNHVLLDCGGFHVLLAHLRHSSLRVEEGDVVSTGAVLGEVGNSGNSSEPHLHVHAQAPGPPDAPFAGEPMALRIDGRHPVRNMRLRVE